jgi:GntR family transcriptional regulator, N-acetylglucosamine utilization regulator
MNFTKPLDKATGVPLYLQLKAVLLERIRSGQWKPNDRLPTEDELGLEFGVSKITVRQAVRILAQAGFVRREQGRGTFVGDNQIRFGPRLLNSFTDEMRETGMQPGSRVLEQKIVPATTELAEKLHLAAGAEVFLLHRLRLAGGEPMGLQTVYVPYQLVPGITEIDFGVASLYETLERRYGAAPDHASQKHFATLADRKQARLLKIKEGSPLLSGERLTFLRGGRPLELTHSAMRGDRYQIELKLVRPSVR